MKIYHIPIFIKNILFAIINLIAEVVAASLVIPSTLSMTFGILFAKMLGFGQGIKIGYHIVLYNDIPIYLKTLHT